MIYGYSQFSHCFDKHMQTRFNQLFRLKNAGARFLRFHVPRYGQHTYDPAKSWFDWKFTYQVAKDARYIGMDSICVILNANYEICDLVGLDRNIGFADRQKHIAKCINEWDQHFMDWLMFRVEEEVTLLPETSSIELINPDLYEYTNTDALYKLYDFVDTKFNGKLLPLGSFRYDWRRVPSEDVRWTTPIEGTLESFTGYACEVGVSFATDSHKMRERWREMDEALREQGTVIAIIHESVDPGFGPQTWVKSKGTKVLWSTDSYNKFVEDMGATQNASKLVVVPTSFWTKVRAITLQ